MHVGTCVWGVVSISLGWPPASLPWAFVGSGGLGAALTSEGPSCCESCPWRSSLLESILHLCLFSFLNASSRSSFTSCCRLWGHMWFQHNAQMWLGGGEARLWAHTWAGVTGLWNRGDHPLNRQVRKKGRWKDRAASALRFQAVRQNAVGCVLCCKRSMSCSSCGPNHHE